MENVILKIYRMINIISTPDELNSKLISFEKNDNNHYVICRKNNDLPIYYSYEIKKYPKVIIIKVESLEENKYIYRTNFLYNYKNKYLIEAKDNYLEKILIRTTTGIRKVDIKKKRIKMNNFVLNKVK